MSLRISSTRGYSIKLFVYKDLKDTELTTTNDEDYTSKNKARAFVRVLVYVFSRFQQFTSNNEEN
jgi:hypothetical protein